MAMNSIGSNPKTTTQQIFNQPGLADVFIEMESFSRFTMLFLQMPSLLPNSIKTKTRQNMSSAFTWTMGGFIAGCLGNLELKNHWNFLKWPAIQRLPTRLAVFVTPFVILYPLVIKQKLDNIEKCR